MVSWWHLQITDEHSLLISNPQEQQLWQARLCKGTFQAIVLF